MHARSGNLYTKFYTFSFKNNDCTYTICFYIIYDLILQFKIWYKAIQNRLKARRAMATES